MNAAERDNALQWLYEKGNPILRLLAAGRLGLEQEDLRAQMLAHGDVRYWLSCLPDAYAHISVHNSFDACLENCLRKLALFGVREQDSPKLAALNRFLVERLERRMEQPELMNPLELAILASSLTSFGHGEEPVVHGIRTRLEDCFAFARAGDFDIHTNTADYPTIPAGRGEHPLVHPRFYEGNRWQFPMVYDLYAFANLPAALRTEAGTQEMVDAVIANVLDERYQRLPRGYGLMLDPPRSYFSIGWSVHLPLFFSNSGDGAPDPGTLWWAEAMAHFPVTATSIWFARLMEHLESFRTAEGFYRCPAAYLTENSNKYFVGGGHMGLGEERRARDRLTLESTAWLLRIDEALHAQK